MQQLIRGVAVSGVLCLVACGGGGNGLDGRNLAPVISAIADQTVAANDTVDVAFTVSDDRTAPASLQLSVSSDAAGLIGTDGLQFAGSGGSRSLSITPEANQLGSAVVTLTVSDSAGLSSSESFLLTVEPLAVSFRDTFRSAFGDDATADPRPINHLQFVQDAEEADFSDLL